MDSQSNTIEQDKMRIILTQAVVSLCNAGLTFSREMTVEGLLGITLDKENVVLVNIKEIIHGAKGNPSTKYYQWPSMAPKLANLVGIGQSGETLKKTPSKRKSIPKKVPQTGKKRGRPPKKLIVEEEDILSVSEEDSDEDRIIKEEFGEDFDQDDDNTVDYSGEGTSSRDWDTEETPVPEKKTSRRAKRKARTTIKDSLLLPDPEEVPEKSDLIRFVNKAVTDAINTRSEKRRKRGEYNVYSPELRARIGQHAVEYGINSATRYFTQELGKSISESTVRAMKRQYIQAKEETNEGVITELPQGTRGRKSLLQKYYDDEIMEYVETLKKNGGAVTPQIVIDAAKGILMHHDKLLLKEYGGPIELTKGWADGFIRRMEKQEDSSSELTQDSNDIPVHSESNLTLPSNTLQLEHGNMKQLSDNCPAHSEVGGGQHLSHNLSDTDMVTPTNQFELSKTETSQNQQNLLPGTDLL